MDDPNTIQISVKNIVKAICDKFSEIIQGRKLLYSIVYYSMTFVYLVFYMLEFSMLMPFHHFTSNVLTITWYKLE
jgi:hypothetical protein